MLLLLLQWIMTYVEHNVVLDYVDRILAFVYILIVYISYFIIRHEAKAAYCQITI